MVVNMKCIRHSYKVERVKKCYTVYQLEPTVDPIMLTELIRIEQFRNYSNGTGFLDYLRLKNTSNWQTSELVTGLKKTDNPNVFYGDRLEGCKRSLVVFVFSKNNELLTIDYYDGYYPFGRDLSAIISRY
ncbi:hypothetical protein [Marinifilum flexuosum]|uniref:Uncharacterized protein n=1 Tax=Marinifilum flexuosum TaxID=1117708 RepID=A0A419XA41_9BACT|nr:hypothetical protein [Marinifilum flexuosum]RKE04429.1 hypothetical protein BXY64_1449 [Marinifilum flexuosum]